MADITIIKDPAKLDADLKSIGDSIRAKGGTTAPFHSAAEMEAAINRLPDYELMKQIIDGTLVTLESDSELFTTIGPTRLSNFYNLVTVNLPTVTTLESGAFGTDFSLQTIKLVNCETIDSSAFSSCNSMTEVWLPKARTFDFGVFEYCSSLETLRLPSAEVLKGFDFEGCDALRSLILSNKIVCVAVNDPVINPDCSIYVPKALIEQYKAATNWSLYADQFLAIEDYPEIGGQL